MQEVKKFHIVIAGKIGITTKRSIRKTRRRRRCKKKKKKERKKRRRCRPLGVPDGLSRVSENNQLPSRPITTTRYKGAYKRTRPDTRLP